MPGHRAYHFTHIDNVASVLDARALRCDDDVSTSGTLARETADVELKAKRRRTRVPCAPGGFLSEYVPFYWAPRSPMLLRLATGRVAGYSDGQDPLVFLVAGFDVLRDAGYPLVMTDGHPIARLSRCFTESTEIESAIDWPLMTEAYWNNTDADGDRERRRQAELLVHREVAIEHLLGLAVRTPEMAVRLNALLEARGFSVRVLVRPTFYYEGKP